MSGGHTLSVPGALRGRQLLHWDRQRQAESASLDTKGQTGSVRDGTGKARTADPHSALFPPRNRKR